MEMTDIMESYIPLIVSNGEDEIGERTNTKKNKGTKKKQKQKPSDDQCLEKCDKVEHIDALSAVGDREDNLPTTKNQKLSEDHFLEKCEKVENTDAPAAIGVDENNQFTIQNQKKRKKNDRNGAIIINGINISVQTLSLSTSVTGGSGDLPFAISAQSSVDDGKDGQSARQTQKKRKKKKKKFLNDPFLESSYKDGSSDAPFAKSVPPDVDGRQDNQIREIQKEKETVSNNLFARNSYRDEHYDAMPNNRVNGSVQQSSLSISIPDGSFGTPFAIGTPSAVDVEKDIQLTRQVQKKRKKKKQKQKISNDLSLKNSYQDENLDASFVDSVSDCVRKISLGTSIPESNDAPAAIVAPSAVDVKEDIHCTEEVQKKRKKKKKKFSNNMFLENSNDNEKNDVRSTSDAPVTIVAPSAVDDKEDIHCTGQIQTKKKKKKKKKTFSNTMFLENSYHDEKNAVRSINGDKECIQPSFQNRSVPDEKFDPNIFNDVSESSRHSSLSKSVTDDREGNQGTSKSKKEWKKKNLTFSKEDDREDNQTGQAQEIKEIPSVVKNREAIFINGVSESVQPISLSTSVTEEKNNVTIVTGGKERTHQFSHCESVTGGKVDGQFAICHREVDQQPLHIRSLTNPLLKDKLLVLDLNGLLVDIVTPRPKDVPADTYINGMAIFRRPFYEDFLKFCFTKFEVGIWSSRKRAKLKRVLNYLLGDMKQRLLFCWDASYCTKSKFKTPGRKHVNMVFKDLNRLWNKYESKLPWMKGHFNASNTLLIDDSPYKAMLNPPSTAIFPYEFHYSHVNDNALGDGGELRVYLQKLAEASDVAEFVALNPIGQPPISEECENWDIYCRASRALTPFCPDK